MRGLLWLPRVLYGGALLAGLVSLMWSAPAWGIAVQMLAWAAVLQVLLAIYAEVLRIAEALESGETP